ncbi:hypothetical protein ABEX69_06725 [Bacillus safensis]|uniref:hypothetical protein n=1 Tax=Bacillus safensis TaxID=561879 RepID=UPI00228291E7|nr:hypothetical protein [Bacillus safensis]MCY7563791.1 hypothetical protein [Bacillus safensis]MCY7625499.1 hypothetical protein [Bacillus safensis]MCY7632407.1 hypothetical protein [Bacillus safensis]MCY7646819.1 hypothetical protein [Bacillus safensis]MCY7652549.1 hypothetical protein [Bacillus safensis]
MLDKWEVDLWIENKATSMIKRFYPSIVSKDTDVPLSVVFNRLLEYSRDEKLNLKWEIRCPECFYTLDILDDFPDLVNGKFVYCNGTCQTNYEITTDYIFPVFEFSQEYKTMIKKKEMALKQKKEKETDNTVMVPCLL